jgi:hypothetical protein
MTRAPLVYRLSDSQVSDIQHTLQRTVVNAHLLLSQFVILFGKAEVSEELAVHAVLTRVTVGLRFLDSVSGKTNKNLFCITTGEFHDQADAKWIVIRGLLKGHNDTPCGLSVTRGLATLIAYLVFSETINQ